MGELRLATQKTTIRRTVALGDDGTVYITAYVPVEERDDETGKAKRFTLPVTLSRSSDGTIRVHGPAASLFGIDEPMPEGVGMDLPRNAPPASHDGAMMSIATLGAILRNERPDIAGVYRDLRASFLTFVAYPAGDDVTPEDYAAFCACYVLSTYLLAAMPAVGYLWLTGLPGSGKTTVLVIIARTAFLPLLASASSTLAAIRAHADGGGTLLYDNWDTILGKDDATRAVRSFWELGYTPGARVTLMIPSSTSRGWEQAMTNVYANRAATAVAEPPDALDSRSIKPLMFRTDDVSKGALSPWDDDTWPVAPNDLTQRCWMVALYHLADAARIVRTITSAETNLTNRDLQVWRPALTVARMVDTANGDTAATAALLRLARWLLKQRAEDDGSREATLTRALVAIAGDGNRTTTTGVTLSMVKKQYQEQHGIVEQPGASKDAKDDMPWGLENVKKIGVVFRKIGVPKQPRAASGNIYDISEPVITRLTALYLPPEASPTTAPYNTTHSTLSTHSTFNPSHDDGWSDVDRAENAECVDQYGRVKAPDGPGISAGSEGNAGCVGSGVTVQDAWYGGDVATETVADDVIADAWSALITWATGRCEPFTDTEEEAARIVTLRIVPGESLGRTASRVFEQERAWRTGCAEGMAAHD